MSTDLVLVLALLAASVAMFMLNRPRMDAVALIMIVALPMTGIITMAEAVAGFGDPNILLIAALFVVGEGLVRTGIASRTGDWLARVAGSNRARLIVLLMVVVAGIGSVMSSTGVVAIFIPIVLRVARQTGLRAGSLMMPLSVAALISGMMTLVATAPNLVIHGELVRRGLEGFGFFSFTPFGLPVLVLAILWMLAASRWLGRDTAKSGPARPGLHDWVADYALAGRDRRLRVRPESPLVGRTLTELDLRGSEGISILAVERAGRFTRHLIQPRADTRIMANDVLLLDLAGAPDRAEVIEAAYGLQPMDLGAAYYLDHAQELGMAEVMIPATSDLIGASLVQAAFRSRRGLHVIGLKRGMRPVEGNVALVPLALGDTLLVIGPWEAVRQLQGDVTDLVVLSLPRESEDVLPAPEKAPFALAALALMVLLMVTGLVPNLSAALIAGLIMGAAGCIDFKAAYRSVHWQSLVLILGMLPFSVALQRTGGVDLAAAGLLGMVGDLGPRLVLAMIFVTTALLGLFISNTATAVLMAPIAIKVAEALALSPYPFAMAVALAASAAFMTPVSSPVNTLVVGPGRFGFSDFVKTGVPLALMVLVVCVALVPVVIPF